MPRTLGAPGSEPYGFSAVDAPTAVERDAGRFEQRGVVEATEPAVAGCNPAIDVIAGRQPAKLQRSDSGATCSVGVMTSSSRQRNSAPSPP